jgi:carbonic anhydrase
MKKLMQLQLAITCLLLVAWQVTPRSWEDCVSDLSLENDGAPRVALLEHSVNDNDVIDNLARDIEIVMHGHPTTLFEEVDPYRITSAPSSSPSATPSIQPSGSPSVEPTSSPSVSPTISLSPTEAPTEQPTIGPTMRPTFAAAIVPNNPKPGYFNYDESSQYGPRNWKNIEIDQSNPGFFHERFDLDEGARISNDCGTGERQSPIDLCRAPRNSCKETHEMRYLPGDYEMAGNFIEKQILPSMLRLVMEPRTGEEPDPPQIDFSANGRGITDMSNIDFKFPSEHTICGHRLDGEMQYYTFHPDRKDFVAVAFFLDATEGNPRNNHLQEVIDAFTIEFEKDRRKCEEKQRGFAGSFVNGRRLDMINSTSIFEHDLFKEDWSNSTLRSKRRKLSSSWHPFDPDIQKTVHFWGYGGSLTEIPCTKNSVNWKVMDVPTPISPRQLQQFKHLLFNHVDADCKRTSVHNSEGSVARPTQPTSRYYKCTRDDYVSDEERIVCGDLGCAIPFGAGLNPYYEPLVHVTGPPTRSPSRG